MLGGARASEHGSALQNCLCGDAERWRGPISAWFEGRRRDARQQGDWAVMAGLGVASSTTGLDAEAGRPSKWLMKLLMASRMRMIYEEVV